MPAHQCPTISLRPSYRFYARDFSLFLGEKTQIMGIINVTPDSFSGDGVLNTKDFTSAAFRLACRQIRQGADLIDIGGESSRPGAQRISTADEITRVIPVITKLAKVCKVPISVDTYKSQTALHALDAGASIINNIQATRSQKSLLKMVARYKAGIVLMHGRATPSTMQKKTFYKNLLKDIIDELQIALENCLEIGIKSDNIIIDPGIGFAKTCEQNLKILNCLREFEVLRRPLLIGTSRKSFIGKILDLPPQKRLIGTVASAVVAIVHGAHILRVHDVAKHKQAAALVDAIRNET